MTGVPEAFEVIVVGARPRLGGGNECFTRSGDRQGTDVRDREPLGPGQSARRPGRAPKPPADRWPGLPGLLCPNERVSRFQLVAGNADTTGTALNPGYVVPRAELDHRLMLAAGKSGVIYRQHAGAKYTKIRAASSLTAPIARKR